MYYSAIGLLAVLILLIENQDVIRNLEGAFEKPAWKVYRRFLIAVLAYYVTDILWGVIESARLPGLLFADTGEPTFVHLPKREYPLTDYLKLPDYE